jgi:hypothetical protein
MERHSVRLVLKNLATTYFVITGIITDRSEIICFSGAASGICILTYIAFTIVDGFSHRLSVCSQ